MSIIHTAFVRHSGGSKPVEQAHSIEADSEQNLSLEIADSVTDQLVAFTSDFSQLKLLTIKSDQDILIETNADDAVGGQAINITGGVPFQWIFGSGITNPITTDITALYITNASGNLAKIEIRSLEDPTV